MFKSFINPQKIIGNGTKAASPEAFSNFMSGGKAALGSSVSSGAANNISSFARSGVAAAGNSNITPSITNISTSIVNNVDNSVSNVINSFKSQVQSVLGGVQSNLSATIQNFSKDYQQRIQNKEDNKPSNILKGFLGLYQNAINFVTFFGDSKNNKKIEFTLKSLRNMFSDSFNTAAIIRQTIVKIVKQLSNLPTASGASGGLNLDVKVPGGALKQSGRATLSKFAGSRGGKLFGAGVVGAGAVGLGMMGMQSAKASQEEKLAETAKKGVGGEDKPNDFMKGLNSIAERFSDAIDSLLGRSKKPPGGGGASGAGAAGAGAGAAGAGAGATPDVSSSPGDLKLAGFLSTLESTGNQNQADVLQSVINRTSQNYSGYGGLGAQITAKSQYSPLSAAIYSTSTDTNASNAYGKIAQKLGKTPTERIQKLQQIASQPDGLQQLQQLFGAGSAADAARVISDFQNNGPLSKSSASFVKGRTNFGAESGVGGAQGAGQIKRGEYGANTFGGVNSQKPAAALSQIGISTPTPSTVIPQAAQKPASTVNAAPPTQKAQEVSQAVTAPPGQDVNEVKVASIPAEVTNISLGGSQDGGGAVASLPAPSYAGPNVAGFGDTRNNNHPNLYSSVILGIIA